MKQIFKRTLFIFMSILLAQSYNIQAAAAAAGVAGRTAADAIGAALPLMKTAAKEALNANAPKAVGFFRTCGQKMGAAAMTYFFRPIFVLTKTTVIGTATVLGLYGGGKLLLEKGAVPVAAPALVPVPTPKVAEATQGIYERLINNWNWGANTPKVIAANAGKKVAEKASSSGYPAFAIAGLDYMKSTWPVKKAMEYPTVSKSLLAYAAAGYVYLRVIKRLQLNNHYKKLLTGLHAAQNNRPTDASWTECLTILRNSGRGYPQNPTIDNAVDYMKDLTISNVENYYLDKCFCLPIFVAKASSSDKILWMF